MPGGEGASDCGGVEVFQDGLIVLVDEETMSEKRYRLKNYTSLLLTLLLYKKNYQTQRRFIIHGFIKRISLWEIQTL